MDQWISVASQLPKEGQAVVWIAPGGEVVEGRKGPGKLWFLPGGMYVYYEPVFWKPKGE